MEAQKKKDYLRKVKILRERLCMGIQEGMDLLVQTDGDMEQAAVLFKEKILKVTMDFIRLPAESVVPFLEKYHYDAGRAIDMMLDEYRLVDGVPQSEPVYILHKFRNHKMDAIKKIAGLIEKKEQLERNWKSAGYYEYPPLDEIALKRLSEPSLCVLVLSEWLDYEDSEGFEASFFYLLDLAAAQLRLLDMAELAAALLMARDIYKEHFEVHQHEPSLYKALNRDTDYQAARRYFQKSRESLVQNLYNFIQNNLDKLNLPA